MNAYDYVLFILLQNKSKFWRRKKVLFSPEGILISNIITKHCTFEYVAYVL